MYDQTSLHNAFIWQVILFGAFRNKNQITKYETANYSCDFSYLCKAVHCFLNVKKLNLFTKVMQIPYACPPMSYKFHISRNMLYLITTTLTAQGELHININEYEEKTI